MTTSRAVLEKEGVRFGLPRLPSRGSTRRRMRRPSTRSRARSRRSDREPGTPVARVRSVLEAAASRGYDRVIGIVIGYVLLVVTLVSVMLMLLKTDW
jgi:hypothetical protein